MEESFEVRVKRLFGSHLFDSVPTSSFPASSWSVAAGAVERQEWKRSSGDGGDEDDDEAGDRGDTPCSSAFYDKDGCFASKKREKKSKDGFEADRDELDEDEEGDRDGDDEDRVIRSSIGLDLTLDHEEEEDQYDREALGQDSLMDRVYMNEIMDRGPHINIHSVVPDLTDDTSYHTEFHRDPRADHSAATNRLREDKILNYKNTPGKVAAGEEDANLKPILKRKVGQEETKTKKRVRFGNEDCTQETLNSPTVPQSMDITKIRKEDGRPGVPDYIKNPGKYTRYTLDQSDCSDETNSKAFQDFRNLISGSNPNPNPNLGQVPPELAFELPASVTFTPRKKLCDAMSIDEGPNCNNNNSGGPDLESSSCFMGIAARESELRENELRVTDDACDMEEDSRENFSFASKKQNRRYRSKSIDD